MPPNSSEDQTLAKYFKYFDLLNTGIIFKMNKKVWPLQVIGLKQWKRLELYFRKLLT